ncbi:MAG: hypothetical protein LWW96_04300 [Acidovorax sp.]|uniref:hypothetical protein n=1 Tax=Acidovorax sp. TaxID=1872122 RepID=UPI0025C0B437|nr:hypothetical protein [Acidovorax sp.]MCE1191358.1 hypothetical protein [Acidovorax sp.]
MSAQLRAFIFHSLGTLVAIAGVGYIVFIYWFPTGLGELAGRNSLYGLCILGLFTSGPLLTALLYRSSKSQRALFIDMLLVAGIQCSALFYGVNALIVARPLALIFETDRFRMVTYADVPEQSHPLLEDWILPWSLRGYVVAGLRAPASEAERLQRFDDLLADIGPSQRPVYWQDISLSAEDIRNRSRPLADLINKYPAQRKKIEAIAHQAAATEKNPDLVWVPLVSRLSLDWIIVLNVGTLKPMGFLPLDGFI